MSSDDADNLRVPLGLFISKDEPKQEYDKMVEKLKSKPFADKIAYKDYPTMYVQLQDIIGLIMYVLILLIPAGFTDG